MKFDRFLQRPADRLDDTAFDLRMKSNRVDYFSSVSGGPNLSDSNGVVYAYFGNNRTVRTFVFVLCKRFCVLL